MKDNETISSYTIRLIGYQTKFMNTRRAILDEDVVTHMLNFISTIDHPAPLASTNSDPHPARMVCTTITEVMAEPEFPTPWNWRK